MRVSCVLDTNVLVVAMAADASSSIMPIETHVPLDSQQKVLEWLIEFELSPEAIIIDYQGLIEKEYRGKRRTTKLSEQDYSFQVIRRKIDQERVTWVELELDEHDLALLPPGLSLCVTDTDDRKMVAAVLAATQLGDDARLVNAGDTDWYDCEEALLKHGVKVQQLLDDWLRKIWRDKKKK